MASGSTVLVAMSHPAFAIPAIPAMFRSPDHPIARSPDPSQSSDNSSHGVARETELLASGGTVLIAMSRSGFATISDSWDVAIARSSDPLRWSALVPTRLQIARRLFLLSKNTKTTLGWSL